MNTFFTQQQNRKNTQRGFTLIETIIAIFILSATVGSLLQLTSQGFYTVRYLRNQIVANNLMQEGLEFVRNTRDTMINQDSGITQTQSAKWNDWVQSMTVAGCVVTVANTSGCIIDPYDNVLINNGVPVTGGALPQGFFSCASINGKNGSTNNKTCPPFYFYESSGFYGYDGHTYNNEISGDTTIIQPYATDYVRTIKIYLGTGDTDFQAVVVSTVDWKNAEVAKTMSQSMLLTNW